MTMDADLREKLDEARATLADLVVRLREHDSLAESLNNSNRQLGQAVADTSELVKSAHATQESLAHTLEKIQGVMDVLNRLDPAPVLSSVESAQTSIDHVTAIIQEQFEALREKITSSSQAIQQHLDTAVATIQEQSEALREIITSSNQATQKHFDAVISITSMQQARDARFLKIVGIVTLLAATTAVFISVIAIASP